ncbi:MAG: hypothetical protein ABI203_03155 [Mucilaginibacter sp.]
MLQNRVNPFGQLITTPARGAWMGNRGLIHDDEQNVLRPFKLKAWLICLLEFKGWKRPIMAPRQYTELFFFDEATAYAAGHRPCFECRRADYNKFKSLWLKANPEYGFNEKVYIRLIDEIIHGERIDSTGAKVKYEDHLDTLPDGTFLELGGKPYVLNQGSIYPWSPSGYGERDELPKTEMVTVLTPRSVVNTFRAGLKPQIYI